MELFSANIAEILTAGAAIWAAIIAHRGVNLWRAQLHGTSEYETAKELLRRVYKVREAFKHVRRPQIYAYEYPQNLMTDLGRLDEAHKKEGTAHAYAQRLQLLNETMSVLEEKVIDGLAEFGPDFGGSIIPLRECYATLSMAIQDHIESLDDITRERAERRAASSGIHPREIIYYLGEDPSPHDKLTPLINEAVNRFERALRSKVKS